MAALFGNHEVIPVLAEAGVRLQEPNLRRDPPLICAARNGTWSLHRGLQSSCSFQNRWFRAGFQPIFLLEEVVLICFQEISEWKEDEIKGAAPQRPC